MIISQPLPTTRSMEKFVSEAWGATDGITIMVEDTALLGIRDTKAPLSTIAGRADDIEALIAALPTLHSRGGEFTVLRDRENSTAAVILFPED